MSMRDNERKELINELRKMQKLANQRLARLEKTFGKNTWASKNLKSKLEATKIQAWSRNNRIKFNKEMNITQLRAIKKATETFLKSETSTVRGAKNVTKKIVMGIQKRVGENKKVSFRDAEVLSDIFEKRYNWILKYLDYDVFYELVDEAKSGNADGNDWIDLIEQYISVGNDLTMIRKVLLLYNHFVAPLNVKKFMDENFGGNFFIVDSSGNILSQAFETKRDAEDRLDSYRTKTDDRNIYVVKL